MPLELLILVLQALQLNPQALRILTLLLIRSQPILAKHNVISQRYGKCCCCNSCHLAPTHMAMAEQTRHGAPDQATLESRLGTHHHYLSTKFVAPCVKWKTPATRLGTKFVPVSWYLIVRFALP